MDVMERCRLSSENEVCKRDDVKEAHRMVDSNLKFRDRSEAGRQLAEKLESFRLRSPLVYAIPRSGLPVARAIADRLGSFLDVAPGPETEHAESAEFSSLTADNLEGIQEGLDASGMDLIIADDVIATGAITSSAVRMLKSRGAGRIVVAAAVVSRSARQRLEGEGAEVCAIHLLDEVKSLVDHFIEDDIASEKEVQETRVSARLSRKTLGQSSLREVRTSISDVSFSGTLSKPVNTRGVAIVLKSHDTNEDDERLDEIVRVLHESSVATLVIDLADQLDESESVQSGGRTLVQVASRVLGRATDWLAKQRHIAHLPVGYCASGIGAAAVIAAAASMPERARVVVGIDGKMDLAEDYVTNLMAATLLIVNQRNSALVSSNREITREMENEFSLIEIAGRDEEFSSEDVTREVVRQTKEWFGRYLTPSHHALGVTPAESEGQSREDGEMLGE
jgi:putative phosphoribosyl transferase